MGGSMAEPNSGAWSGTGGEGELRSEGKAKADELKQAGREKLKEVKVEARERTRELTDRAGEEAEQKASEAADRLEAVVRALESAADRLEEDGQAWLGDGARRAAGQVQRMTGYLRDRDAGAMMRDLEDTAREHPGTFLGGAFASGLALGRFLRSSAPTVEDDRGAFGGDGNDGARGGRWSSPGALTDRDVARRGERTPGEAELDRPGGNVRGGVMTGGSAMASEAAGGLPARGGEPSTGTREE